MKSKLVGTLAVALMSLGIFAGTAGASGISSGHSVNSQYRSVVGGTCVADDYAAAGNVSRGAPVYGWTDLYEYSNCYSVD